MYYLQSRYYDPAIGRFINADCYASTGQGFIGYNMFSYCGNNPTSRIEQGGFFWREIGELGKRTIEVGLVIGGIGATIALIAGIVGFTIGTGGVGGLAIAAAIPMASALLESSALATAAGIVMAAAGNAGSNSNSTQGGRKQGIPKQESKIWNDLQNVRGKQYKFKGHGHNRYYYDWDYTHNEIEVYDYKGRHLGAMDPQTGEFYKAAVPGRSLSL